VHGFAGDLVAAQRGEIGMIASDIIEMLPGALRGLSERRAKHADFKLQTKRIKLTDRRRTRTP
jgi:hypothetical protein